MDVPFLVRPATEPDLSQVTQIEREVFSDPWPRSAFLTIAPEFAWVAESGGEVLGYLFGRVAADEAEVLNLAVRPEYRRQGIARSLLDTAVMSFLEADTRTIYLEVRETNHAAQTFYRSYGFQVVGKRPRYYRNPPEAAVLMALATNPRFRSEKKRS